MFAPNHFEDYTLDAKKPSFTGSSKLDERFGLKPTVTVDVKDEDDPDTPPENFEVWESPGRELRATKHQVFSVQLIHRDGSLRMIPYSAVDAGAGKYNGDRFTFRFWVGEAAYEATIEGTIKHTQRVVDYFCAGKAEMIRANGEELRSVTWELLEAPPEAATEREED
jgi:hypothetical protein